MMMTPAGTLKPANVFVIGAGVAGLQAIATAKRLGAKVVAFDTRPVVAEQVRSVGAKFLEIDLGETGETKDGYAKCSSRPSSWRSRSQGQEADRRIRRRDHHGAGLRPQAAGAGHARHDCGHAPGQRDRRHGGRDRRQRRGLGAGRPWW
jgi:hypothetical protein